MQSFATLCTVAHLQTIAETSVVEKAKIHFGRWLRARIEESGTPYARFAAAVDVDKTTLWRWMKQAAPRVREYNLALICRELGFAVDHVRGLLVEAMRDDPKMKALWKKQEERLRGTEGDYLAQAHVQEQMINEGLVENEQTVAHKLHGLDSLPEVVAWIKSLTAEQKSVAISTLAIYAGSFLPEAAKIVQQAGDRIESGTPIPKPRHRRKGAG